VVGPFDPGRDGQPEFLPGCPPLTVEDVLLQQREEGFRRRVVRARTAPARRTGQPVVPERFDESVHRGRFLVTVQRVAGMIAYVSLLQHVDVIDTLAKQALALGAPLVIALFLCYVIGVGTALASSTSLLTALIPMAGPLLATSSLSASGTVAALTIAATVVDVSPFSTDCALVVVNARENDRQRVYRQLMMCAGAIVLVAPALAWVLLVPTGIM
jgi:hypothetical protein